MKVSVKNPFERMQKSAAATLCILMLAVILILAGSFSSCFWDERHENDSITSCDPKQYPSFIWVYDFIKECLETGFHGRISHCTYRDGYGFLIESHENDGTEYSLLNCEGIVVYEGENKPIQEIHPELNIENDRLLCGIYPLWEEDDTDGFECNANPYTLPLIKKYLDELFPFPFGMRISINISQFIYKDSSGIFNDGIGFWYYESSSWSRTAVYVNCMNELLFSYSSKPNVFFNMEHSEHIHIEKYKIILTLN